MSIRLLTCVWIAGLVQAQNPCRVNVIFSLEASTYVNSEGSTVSSSTSIVTTSSTPSYSCGNGSWALVENRCLSFESTQKEWTAASRYCHSLGGVLVTIFDNKDEDFLYGNADTVAFFIGLNDIVKNGTWLWDQPTGQTLSAKIMVKSKPKAKPKTKAKPKAMDKPKAKPMVKPKPKTKPMIKPKPKANAKPMILASN
uniref:C-type lectin domain-containing protein n=1 Tax=Acrobeloides nanus TaxID=290746 RepID=A0A914BUV9_9BILA